MIWYPSYSTAVIEAEQKFEFNKKIYTSHILPSQVRCRASIARIGGTRARFGRVAPLGRPRPVSKSDVECRFVSPNGQMTLKVKVNASHFQYHLQEFQDAFLVHFQYQPRVSQNACLVHIW